MREEDEEDVEAAYLEGWAWFLWGEEVELMAQAEAKGEKKQSWNGGVEGAEEDEEVLEKRECWEEARESLSVCEIVSSPDRSWLILVPDFV